MPLVNQQIEFKYGLCFKLKCSKTIIKKNTLTTVVHTYYLILSEWNNLYIKFNKMYNKKSINTCTDLKQHL